jgi:hypothetical protein
LQVAGAFQRELEVRFQQPRALISAFYLARIIGVELPWQQNLTKRDAAIANLRAKL